MLKFFKVFIKYECRDDEYMEPAEDPTELIKNIMRHELFDISYPNRPPLKYFTITKS